MGAMVASQLAPWTRRCSPALLTAVAAAAAAASAASAAQCSKLRLPMMIHSTTQSYFSLAAHAIRESRLQQR